MASLRVPNEYVGGLAKFLKLSDKDAKKLFSLLEQSPGSKSPGSTLREAIASLAVVPKSDVDQMAEAVLSLYALWIHSNQSATERANEIAQAIDESAFEELKFGSDVRGRVQSRLNSLFALNSFVVVIKADAERFEYDRVFSKANVSTDIRPIFGASTEEAPKVAMLAHTLNIHYLHDGRHREFYVALDEVDLESLIEELESARLKADSLGAILKAANLTHFIPD